jgi:hypothetical protein
VSTLIGVVCLRVVLFLLVGGWVAVSRGEFVEPWGFGQVQAAQDVLVPGGEFAALGDGAFGGAQHDEVESFEVVAQVAPGVAAGEFGHAQQEQGQPA